jgi:hypothetical protein
MTVVISKAKKHAFNQESNPVVRSLVDPSLRVNKTASNATYRPKKIKNVK